MRNTAQDIVQALASVPDVLVRGRVSGLVGLIVEASGLDGFVALGDRCRVVGRGGSSFLAEVVGFRAGTVLLMPYSTPQGIGTGAVVETTNSSAALNPDPSWLGRVIDGLGQPLDGKGPLAQGDHRCPLIQAPPNAHARQRIGPKIDLGVRTINAFLTCCRGQRMGIFAGSGVGKSTLLSMMARRTDAEVIVIGLIGERGREAREFIEDDLGPEGLARSVVVVATSDQSPPLRRQAAYATLAVAEYFRDQGAQVLCLMDSVTRFAMAQREIGLAAGEPPTTKGYTPSVFAELPRLLERAGPGGPGQGSITGLFTVLVDGDDHNEPVADAVRGILDGHIVLDRAIAERGRFPAINVLRSVSRVMPGCNTAAENEPVIRARQILSTYEDMAELIRLGAYRRGTDPDIDEAIRIYPQLEAFLAQRKDESASLSDVYKNLRAIVAPQKKGGSSE